MTPHHIRTLLKTRVVLPAGGEATFGDLLVSFTNLYRLTEGSPGGDLDRACEALSHFANGQALASTETELLRECQLITPEGRPDDPLLVELARSCLVSEGGRYRTLSPLHGHPLEPDFNMLLAAMGNAVGFLARHSRFGPEGATVPAELIEHSAAQFRDRLLNSGTDDSPEDQTRGRR